MVMAVLATIAVSRPALAARVPSGGNPADECLVEFDVVGVPDDGGLVSCTDCDPGCDRDGAPGPNGSCEFRLGVCLGQESGGCEAAAPAKIRIRPKGALVPPAPALGACGPLASVVVKTKRTGRTPGARTVKAQAATTARPRRRDRDRARLVCLPRAAGEPCPGEAQRPPCLARSPIRNLYFGDLHVHTAWSFDAWVFGVRTTPTDAYRFARGATLHLPAFDPADPTTQSARLERPLDFAAVTDHSEFLGETQACITPGAAGYESENCAAFRAGGAAGQAVIGTQTAFADPQRDATICGADGAGCRTLLGETWRRTIDAADAATDGTDACAFTALVGYEYTANTNVSTQHRNVIFRGSRVPEPVSYFEEPTAAGLWAALRNVCLEAGSDCDALAIPHNSNESNGRMFALAYADGADADAQRAAAHARAAIEPLMEIYQHKGDSECQNGLAGILGEADEFCAFEKRPRDPLTDCGDAVGSGGVVNAGCYSRLDFLRGALLAGLAEQARIGANPLKLGVVASTDTHNGLAGAVDEPTFAGHRGSEDDTALERLEGGTRRSGTSFSPGGLAGVWAQENTRAALFDALRRREVFGTSGPRIAVRFFGGWDLPEGLCEAPDTVEQADGAGVPMGGTLPERAGAAAPAFLVSALRDAGTTARPGALLERVQIVKTWVAGGEPHQRVYDVIGPPAEPLSVDPATCATTGNGFHAPCAVWTDPDFDPAHPAAYYVRVLEVPTCRWTAHACNALSPESRPAACDDAAVPKVLQERAWTSPIWFEP
jgi:hypothetical protein